MARLVVNDVPNSNASLSFWDGKRVRAYNFWLTEVSQDHQLSGTARQSRMYQHFYGRSYSPGQVQIIGKVKNQTQYNTLAKFVRHHHEALMSAVGGGNLTTNTNGLPLMSLHIQAESLYYSGWISTFQGGAKRFNVAPEISFGFEVVNDRHSTNDKIRASGALRATWNGSFLSGAVSDTRAAQEDAGTYIAPTRPPAQTLRNNSAG